VQSDDFEIVAALPSQAWEAVRTILELEGMLDYSGEPIGHHDHATPIMQISQPIML